MRIGPIYLAPVAGLAEREARSDVAVTLAMACLGAALSLAATGLVFFIDNNIFQLPILGRLYDLPQYADDQFIQSLRYYSSGLWQALSGIDRLMDPWWPLFVLGVATRVLVVFGFLQCASLLGVTERRHRLVFVVLLAGCDLLKGYSFAGSGGLFLNYATHSEFANGLLLLSWASAARGRFAIALALTGAVFFCNSFMAIWNVLPLIAIAIHRLRSEPVDLHLFAREIVLGTALSLIFALPVIVMIVTNPDFGVAPPIDYRAFLANYWPWHFLFGNVPVHERVGLILVIALAALAFAAVGARAAPFKAAFLGCLALYAFGIVAPWLTASPLVLNLHLLRSGVMLQMLAVLAALSATTIWLTMGDVWRSRLIAPSLVVALCLFSAGALPAVLVFAIERLPPLLRSKAERFLSRRNGDAIRIFTAAGLASAFIAGAVAQEGNNAGYRETIAEWSAMSDWARAHTDQTAEFLIPTEDFSKPLGEQERTRAHVAALGAVFEYRSQRRVWVDFKRGAAVMWSSSYYERWRARTNEVLGLLTLGERVAYAKARRVGYVIDLCTASEQLRPLFRTEHLCVFSSDAAGV